MFKFEGFSCRARTKNMSQTKIHHLIVFFTLLIPILTFSSYVKSQGRNDAAITGQAAKDIAQKAEDYLNALSTGRARFVQTTHDGTQLVGTFYIERPGKLRFEYDPPIEDFVVADGFFIYFYDAQLGQQSNAPIGNTLADFFLRKDLALEDDITVDEVRKTGDLVLLKLVQTADAQAGSITLGFSEDPFELKKWRVVDGQGLITEVELFYLKTGITHPADLFIYADPKRGTPRYNK